ncbi:MAG: hypothetical protein KBS60_04120 [Phascolarctobacterium sp.]|nr:hypothetical protein [Candidatus Phascolarctobacterium caballi]
MREQENFPYVRAGLIEAFGNRAWLKVTEVAEYDGCDTRTVRRRYGIPKGVYGINRDILARKICSLSEKSR